jgi:1,5-anhydro-D-fructose reductase (1,5-anhydro-D-mannitol-forming)
VKWALIGASDIAATRVIPAIREAGDQVVGVMSSDPNRGATFAGANGISTSGTTLEAVAGWGADAVYISTTNQLHAEQAIYSARAGLHVLCEKPLAMSIPDVRSIVTACDEAGVVLATNHHLRCKGTVRAVRETIASGQLGELLAVRIHHAVSLPERLRGWRLTDPAAGAGVVLDITVHDADTLRFVTGQEVLRVAAMTSRQGLASEGVEDTAMVTMELDSGALAFAHDSFVVPHAGTSLEVHGSEGSLFAADAMTQEVGGEVLIRHGDAVTAIEGIDRTDPYVFAIRAFGAATRGEGAPAASGADGLLSLAVALAAKRSAELSRTVDLDEVLDEAYS